jgi:hypothetical protein
MVQELWTPPGTVQEETIQIGRVNPDVTRDMAFVYNFTFKYKGKVKRLQVCTDDGTSRAEIEDKAAEAAERWRRELDGKDWKRPPTEAEKKDIGKLLNEFHLRNEKVRASSTGKIYFKGANK